MLTPEQIQMLQTAALLAREDFNSFKNPEILRTNSDNLPICIVCPETRHNLHIMDIAVDYVQWPHYSDVALNNEMDAYLRSILGCQ